MNEEQRPSLRAIMIHFSYPVEITMEEERTIHDIVQAAAKRSSTEDTVHWLAGYGSAHNVHLDEFDDSVLVFECSSRERYDSERLTDEQVAKIRKAIKVAEQDIDEWKKAARGNLQ